MQKPVLRRRGLIGILVAVPFLVTCCASQATEPPIDPSTTGQNADCRPDAVLITRAENGGSIYTKRTASGGIPLGDSGPLERPAQIENILATAAPGKLSVEAAQAEVESLQGEESNGAAKQL